MKQFLETGQIVGTHGVRGEMRVNPWCDTPEFLTQFKKLYLDGSGNKVLKIVSSRVHGNIVLIKAEGIGTIDEAAQMRGKILYMNRDEADIDDGAYFYQDIIGCKVVDIDNGREYGVISEISETGANDVWHIDAGSCELLIPVIDDVVKGIDIDKQVITIRPAQGAF